MIRPITIIIAGALASLLLAEPPEAARAPLRLTLQRAVELALSPEGNSHIQLSREFVIQAQSRSKQARAALLPDLSASAYQESNTRNLEALGLRDIIPTKYAGVIQIPRRVGPFPVFDARMTMVQNVLDVSSIRRFQASKTLVKAAGAESENTDDEVAGQVAKAYVSALRAEAQVDAATANLELANAVLKTAENQKSAGAGTGIDVTRAKVQVANERQRLLVAQNERRRAHLTVLRALGLRLDTEIQLTDRLTYSPIESEVLATEPIAAVDMRSDFMAQTNRQDGARLALSATTLERLPSITLFSDYGTMGLDPYRALPTYTYGVAVRVPIFDGGRRDARRAESQSIYRQEQIRSNDLREQIQLEVQLAKDGLQSADEQVKVAEEGLALANNELAQARRRFEAGVTSSLEVIDAQTRLARARDNRIAALFSHNLARIDLGQATGQIRKMIQ
jgi:outer membrane protein TolC